MGSAATNMVGAGGIGYAITIVLFDWILPIIHCPLPTPENLPNVQSAFTAILTGLAAFVVHRYPPRSV